MIPPTELIHLSYEGNFQLECTSNICGVELVESNNDKDNEPLPTKRLNVHLDRTVLHPQGGGQPTDIGVLMLNNGDTVLQVDKVTIDRSTGIVTHSGTLRGENIDTDNVVLPEIGSNIQVQVDTDQRRILSECHTAGHVVDAAMARCGKTLPPTKGYHFLDGPYVEYKGSIDPKERPQLLENLQAAFGQLVDEDIPTKIEALSKNDAETAFNRVAQNFDLSEYGDEDIRIVTVAGWPCPCGGTHVKSTSDLKERKWGIRGMKSKKGVVRVKYGFEK
mmetsp:Transcript_10991/g.16999  ORF Transcript_10991/g.16999 Transcript_10991/m.16999 type:complete len:276 (+) Transcript_10991:146-973(+)|eukprot:CAMPEP_0195303008 /NCGR_PEP_ID=MMETSP0707-20130614/32080_1 /TAXON_ID=33640 /ORGANISM="Asterionellopsis glacialis, Strain CCMP134" /LENGTH=275 /DNA_ID=CAMNT_0040366423 /DNA_START=60 /DNA_END=887 /DNA_ORIENTATION=+